MSGEQQSTPGVGIIRGLIFVIGFVLVQIGLLATSAPEALGGALIDPDSLTRLLRVERLLGGGGWYEALQPGFNAPYGLDSHWTRAVDVLLVGMAAPFAPLLGWRQALYWAGYCFSPLLALGTFFAFAWAVRPVFGRGAGPLAMVALLAQPAFLNYALAGRADHHMVLLLAFVILLGSVLRVATGERRTRWASVCGVTLGLGVWVSVEFQLAAALVATVLALYWVGEGADWGKIGVRVFGFGLATVALTLIAERGADTLALEYDRISIAHVVAFAFALLFFVTVRMPIVQRVASRGSRAALAVGMAITLAWLLFQLLPGMVPMGAGDPFLSQRFWAYVEELQPLRPGRTGWGPLIGIGGPILLAAGFLLGRLGGSRDDWKAMTVVAVLLGAYTVLGLQRVRFLPYAAAPAAIGVLGVILHLHGRIDRGTGGFSRTLVRAVTSALCLGGFLFLGGMVQGVRSPTPSQDGPAASDTFPLEPCPADALLDYLGSSPERGAVLTHPDLGPEIAYHTGLAVVAAPFHRMEEGLRTYFLLERGEADLHAEITRRGTDLIVLCPARDRGLVWTSRSGAEGTAYGLLMEGPTPPWVRELAGPRGYRVFRVVRDGTG